MANEKESQRYQIMRFIATATYSGEKLLETVTEALKKSSELIGLTAGTLILWDDDFKPIFNATFSSNEKETALLNDLESDLFTNLRKNRKLVSAYVTFGGDRPLAGFTLPVRMGEEIIGAVIGIQPGRKPLVGEDVFLEALTAALSLAVIIDRQDSLSKKIQYDAVKATSASVNHEINNPLQAILGIVQLLPKEKDNLDEATIKKLKVVEEAALDIMKVTHKLMRLSEIEYIDYVDGSKMLKLPEDNDSV
jgi:signal transduction histidine kinase